MRKLSEYKDEEALDLLADILEPAANILADKAVQEAWENGNRLKFAGTVIKKHKKEVIQILATLDGVPVTEFHCNVFTLPARIIEITNDKELLNFFTSQVQEMTESISSGRVMENTEENGQ